MNITFIGGGNMADALIGGLIGKGAKAASLRAVEISADQRDKLHAKYGIACFGKARDAIREGDILILAVKPQQLREAVAALEIKARNAHLIISIAAGVRLTAIAQWLGGYTRLVRAMPNTPALIGEGITGLCSGSVDVNQADRQNAETILSAVGRCVWIDQESQMDAVTAVSGSGPAYVFLFIEALEQAALELGLSAEQSRALSIQTFLGAAKLAAASADPISVLRERVTSKGGTTEAALASMTRDKIRESIVRAVKAANERGRELGEQLGKDG
jgi:pyrroline-5-carboxylate reductase